FTKSKPLSYRCFVFQRKGNCRARYAVDQTENGCTWRDRAHIVRECLDNQIVKRANRRDGRRVASPDLDACRRNFRAAACYAQCDIVCASLDRDMRAGLTECETR